MKKRRDSKTRKRLLWRDLIRIAKAYVELCETMRILPAGDIARAIALEAEKYD